MTNSSFPASLSDTARQVGRGSTLPFEPGSEPDSSDDACRHCGLPVPLARRQPERSELFCCSGCETAFQLLSGAGLGDYYAYRQRLGEVGRPVEETHSSLREFDTETYQRLYCRPRQDGHVETDFLLEGVHCAACVWLVERLPRLAPAAVEARLNLAKGAVTLTWDPKLAQLSEVARTLLRMGYKPRPVRGQEAERLRRDELRGLLIRIGIAGASAGNVMLMAFALYSGEVGIDEAGTMSAETVRFFEVLSAVVSLPALFAAGLFFRGAWSALRTRTAHMDLPIAIGILVGYVWGTYGVVTGNGPIYFDSITAVIFLLLIGRYLQRRHQYSATDAAELLHAVVPSDATVLRGQERLIVPASQVEPGDRVVVGSGQIIVVDGVVETGSSTLDRSLLSGESRPISVDVGATCEAGALNLQSELVLIAVQSGAQTRVARLMTEVEKALSTRTRLVGQADRIAGVFTVSVLGLAAAIGLFWSFRSGSAAIDHALALLIVACPCALGMATPLALSAAVHRAARTRKLVFSPEALEHLARPMHVVLDKTGTLTEGRLSVVGWEGERRFFAALLAAEGNSSHPVAQALVSYLQGELTESDEAAPRVVVRERLGGGLDCDFEGRPLRIGSPRFILERARFTPPLEATYERRDESTTPVLVSWGEQVVGVFFLQDALRTDAASSLLALRRRGHHLHLLSGDDERTVRGAACQLARLSGDEELFESVQGQVTPEQKLARIRTLQGSGVAVAMVGDGVNDAGALAAADVGVAVTGAAEASRMSADVYLGESGVTELVRLFQGSERTLATIRRGLAFSLVYNALGIGAAAMGVLSPLLAAVLMPLSSLTVVTNAYRSRTFSRGVHS